MKSGSKQYLNQTKFRLQMEEQQQKYSKQVGTSVYIIKDLKYKKNQHKPNIIKFGEVQIDRGCIGRQVGEQPLQLVELSLDKQLRPYSNNSNVRDHQQSNLNEALREQGSSICDYYQKSVSKSQSYSKLRELNNEQQFQQVKMQNSLKDRQENNRYNQCMDQIMQILMRVQTNGKTIQEIKQHNSRLQNENKIIKENFRELQQKCQQEAVKSKKYQDQIRQLKQQIKQMKHTFYQMVNQIGEKCQVQQNKIVRILDIMDENPSHKSHSMVSLPVESRASNRMNLDQSSQMSKQKLNTYRIKDLNLPPVNLKPVQISYTTSTLKYYQINANQIQTNLSYVGEKGTWTHILGKNRIDPNKIIQYVFKIKNSASSWISLGIMDKKYESLRSCGKNQKNCIFYYGGSGRLWQSGQKLQKQGKGFKQGDIIIMIVLLKQGAIRWYVNGSLQSQYNSHSIIKDFRQKPIQWVPFVNMSGTGDAIIWQVGQ